MIRVIRAKERTGQRVIALGTFDGVHLGHQALIRAGAEAAGGLGIPLRVYTFDRHPLEVAAPEKAPRLLTTEAEKRERMALLNADELRVLPFDRETADTPPEVFLRQLREETEIRAVAAGWNYTFGKRGEGNADVLREDGARHGYRVIIVPPVRNGAGEIVSSTAIREKLRGGDLAGAAEMLGYAYPISGTAVRLPAGDEETGAAVFGLRIDPRKLLPADGAYDCELEAEGKIRAAIARVETRTGFSGAEFPVTVALPEPAPDPDGREVRIALHLLRPSGLSARRK